MPTGTVTCAADLIERHFFILWHRDGRLISRDRLTALPESVYRAHPLLYTMHAWLLFFHRPGGGISAEQKLQEAQRALMDGTIDPSFHNELTVHTLMMRALGAYTGQQDWSMVIDLLYQALAVLPEHDILSLCSINVMLGRAYLALNNETVANHFFNHVKQLEQAHAGIGVVLLVAYFQIRSAYVRGRLHEAAALCRSALLSIIEPAKRDGHALPGTAYPIYLGLGCILLEWNDLEEAHRNLAMGFELVRSITEPFIEVRDGYIPLALLKRAQGDMAGALEVLERARKMPLESAEPYADAVRARLWLAQPGRPLAAVERWAAGCQVSLDTLHDEHPFALFNHHIHLQQLTLVRLRIARYRERGAPDLQPVLDFLTRDLQRTEQNGWIQQVIELLILLALTLDAQGNTDQALVALQRALALAEPEGYVRTFVDEGAPMAALLERIKDEGGRMKDYITRLLTTFPAEIVSPVVPAFHPSSLNL